MAKGNILKSMDKRFSSRKVHTVVKNYKTISHHRPKSVAKFENDIEAAKYAMKHKNSIITRELR